MLIYFRIGLNLFKQYFNPANYRNTEKRRFFNLNVTCYFNTLIIIQVRPPASQVPQSQQQYQYSQQCQLKHKCPTKPSTSELTAPSAPTTTPPAAAAVPTAAPAAPNLASLQQPDRLLVPPRPSPA